MTALCTHIPTPRRAPRRAAAWALAVLAALPFALAAAPAAAQAEARVLRATFTTAVQAREPVDQVDTLNADVPRIVYFLEVAGLQGRTLTVHWRHEEREVARVELPVGGTPWRTWSSKELQPADAGRWQVVVTVDERVLRHDAFEYSAQMPRWAP